jgi:hypothetical protein
MDQDDVFVIAVKRERSTDVPADWIEVVRGTSGVTVMGDASPSRIQVRASAEAISRIRDRFSDYLHIESLIPHRLS